MSQSNDSDRRALPEWREFRNRYASETEANYRLSRAEYDITQLRQRDHAIVSQQTAILGYQEMLRDDLMGDGTILKPGILNQLIAKQSEIIAEQRKVPDVVRTAMEESQIERRAGWWTETTKLLMWLGSVAISAAVGALAVFLLHR